MPRKLDPRKVECKRCHKHQHDPKYELCFQCRDEVDQETARLRLNARAALTGILAGAPTLTLDPMTAALRAWEIAQCMEGAENKALLERRVQEGW